jgi:hypothetical protein
MPAVASRYALADREVAILTEIKAIHALQRNTT